MPNILEGKIMTPYRDAELATGMSYPGAVSIHPKFSASATSVVSKFSDTAEDWQFKCGTPQLF